MDYSTFLLLLFFLSAFIYAITISDHRNSRLPPGQYAFPIIGNLLELGNKPHRSLGRLSKCYGPLMSLKLGSKTSIVVTSPDIIKEFLHIHDKEFSGRSVPYTARSVDQHKYSMAWLPAEEHWRRLRKIAKEYLFSVQCLDGSERLRDEKVQELVNYVNQCCTNKKEVDINDVAFTTTIYILSNFIFSTDMAQYDSKSSHELKAVVSGLTEIFGKPNLADFFPIIKSLDPQRLLRRGNVYGKKLLTIIDRIIDRRLRKRSSSLLGDGVSCTNNDVLDSLLNLHLKDEIEFSLNDMRHLFLSLFIAGTDTTSNAIEWAMTELLRNPEKMEIARSEVIKHMGNNNRNIQEQDITQLPYLQAIIKETLRLHPPGPFLVPHQAIQDVEVQGFIIPKNAQILCNVWAIGRDPNVWSYPELFIPERFVNSEIDYKGQDFKLIPFSAGRRICPGLNIAHRMLHVMLGSLIHKFDWKPEGNMRPQDMDMDEKFGLTVQRNVPLVAIPIKPCMIDS